MSAVTEKDQPARVSMLSSPVRRCEPSGVIMHTGRGSVYYGWDHRNLIRRHGLIAILSSPGNCSDSEVMESFIHSLQAESIHGVPVMHPDALRNALFETIEVEYDQALRHSALEYIKPDAFETRIIE